MLEELMEYLDDLAERAEMYYQGKYKDGWVAAIEKIKDHFLER